MPESSDKNNPAKAQDHTTDHPAEDSSSPLDNLRATVFGPPDRSNRPVANERTERSTSTSQREPALGETEQRSTAGRPQRMLARQADDMWKAPDKFFGSEAESDAARRELGQVTRLIEPDRLRAYVKDVTDLTRNWTESYSDFYNNGIELRFNYEDAQKPYQTALFKEADRLGIERKEAERNPSLILDKLPESHELRTLRADYENKRAEYSTHTKALGEMLEPRRQQLQKIIDANCDALGMPHVELHLVPQLPGANGAYLPGHGAILIPQVDLLHMDENPKFLSTLLHEMVHGEQDTLVIRNLAEKNGIKNPPSEADLKRLLDLYKDATGVSIKAENSEFFEEILKDSANRPPLTAEQQKKAELLAPSFKTATEAAKRLGIENARSDFSTIQRSIEKLGSLGGGNRAADLIKLVTSPDGAQMCRHLFGTVEPKTDDAELNKLIKQWNDSPKDANGNASNWSKQDERKANDLLVHALEGRKEQINELLKMQHNLYRYSMVEKEAFLAGDAAHAELKTQVTDRELQKEKAHLDARKQASENMINADNMSKPETIDAYLAKVKEKLVPALKTAGSAEEASKAATEFLREHLAGHMNSGVQPGNIEVQFSERVLAPIIEGEHNGSSFLMVSRDKNSLEDISGRKYPLEGAKLTLLIPPGLRSDPVAAAATIYATTFRLNQESISQKASYVDESSRSYEAHETNLQMEKSLAQKVASRAAESSTPNEAVQMRPPRVVPDAVALKSVANRANGDGTFQRQETRIGGSQIESSLREQNERLSEREIHALENRRAELEKKSARTALEEKELSALNEFTPRMSDPRVQREIIDRMGNSRPKEGLGVRSAAGTVTGMAIISSAVISWYSSGMPSPDVVPLSRARLGKN